MALARNFELTPFTGTNDPLGAVEFGTVVEGKFDDEMISHLFREGGEIADMEAARATHRELKCRGSRRGQLLRY